MRRGRPLRPAEARLWAAIVADVRPLGSQAAPPPSPAAEAAVAAATMAETALASTPVVPAERALPRPAPPRPAAKPLVPLDQKTRRAVARGRIRPEASLDLHGMRQDEAHAVLVRFLQGSQRRGIRLVTVVTGKGRPGETDPTERGVLRRSVPHWLALPALRSVVLGWTESAPHRGGSGALLVRLRAGPGREA